MLTLGGRVNPVVAIDWNVEPADVSASIETKVFGD